MAQRRCLKCESIIPPQAGRQQPRKYCITCRPPRGQSNVTDLGRAPQAPSPTAAGSLHGATLTRLREVDRADAPEGMLVLELARQIEAGGHSGASLAALSNAYSKALEAATKDAGQSADIIDHIFGTG